MKKSGICIILLLSLFISGCATKHNADTVKDGTYIMVQEDIEEVFLPSINITGSQITFSYDLLSSYLSIGSYTIEDGKLTMTTDDNKFNYIFEIDGDDLIFKKDESSSTHLTDERFGVKITDGAIFRRKDDNITDVPSPQPSTSTPVSNNNETELLVKPYDDIRAMFGKESTYQENEYDANDIKTFTFNEGTLLIGNEELMKDILEKGKNPGLGIRDLHDEGITGKGINVAIIDQNLLLHHPEFDGKIAGYYDTGCYQGKDNGSMHAPAVTSILVGNTIGVAPDARVYFAAAPSWIGDSEYYAKGLYWIIEENKKLPEGEKIRVVSVSAAPSGEGTVFSKNMEMWDEAVLAAEDAGILVLDCRNSESTGIISPAYYDTEDPENVTKCTGGFPTMTFVIPSTHIGVPVSFRTVAEEYSEGSPSYQYTGQGGLSWGIPYAAGVLALGWQVNPELGNDQIIEILFETCSIAKDGSNIINPVAFIEAVKETLN